MKTAFAVLAVLTAALFSLLVVPSRVYADGLVVVECPPVFLPGDPPVEIQPLGTPGVPPLWATPRPPVPPRPASCPNYLSVKNHNVTVNIEDQIARTHVDETFVNDSTYQLEGTYVFPLPEDAAIGDFSMWVDGKKLEGQVLDRNQARQIYEEIVRRQRDPALLEYVGRNAFQARIFPIPPKSEKRVEIEYSQILKAESGLVRYVYPLNTEKYSPKPVGSVSVNVTVRSTAGLRAVYSPSHDVSVARDGTGTARVGYEATNVKPDRDFVLYYSVAQDAIGVNVLSYKNGNDDGFFVLLVTPQVKPEAQRVADKDVIVVLDTSGSMQGAKIDQAKRAVHYILDHLNGGDRFNVVAFSTGVSTFAALPQSTVGRGEAGAFVDRFVAEGSTDINRALLEAVAGADKERPTVVIFLTDGLPTMGETNSQKIIANVTSAMPRNVRLFTFGIGDDVNTLLLDSLAEKLRGTSAYIRPGEKIDEVVSAFYARVSTPVLTDVSINWGDVTASDVYPFPMPDLFAGSQMVLVGRYRQGSSTTISLKGMVNGSRQEFRYNNLTFRNSGGDDLIPRLWATRKIGYLLNEVRLHGESREVVNEIVTLAVRYGIVTPYTSFLIDERQDVLSEKGKSGVAHDLGNAMAPAAMPTSGAKAVQQSQQQNQMRGAGAAPSASAGQVKMIGDKTFILRDGVWLDTQYDPSKMSTHKVEFGGDAYFQLSANAEWARYLGTGPRVIVVLGNEAYEATTDGSGASSGPVPTPATGGDGRSISPAAPEETAAPASTIPDNSAAGDSNARTFNSWAWVGGGLVLTAIVGAVWLIVATRR